MKPVRHFPVAAQKPSITATVSASASNRISGMRHLDAALDVCITVGSCHAASLGECAASTCLKTSGFASLKNINRARGMPEERHSETDGGLISQMRATSAVPPMASIIAFA